MRRPLQYSLLLALLLALITRAASGASVEQVEKAIRAGVDHLYQVQSGDNWDNGWNQDNGNTGGRTALVTYALLAAGESPQNPKLKSAVDFLLKQKPPGIYTLGLRCNVWFLLPQTPEVKEIFRADALQLQQAMKVRGKARGLFNYTKDGGLRYDHSVSWYGVERIGVASGLKYFGNVNWYQHGADHMVASQNKEGAWGEVTDTAFAILFLVRGRAPVMMNKLEYVVDTAGDKPKPPTWNQRPRDVGNIARWTGRQIEKDLNWQIVNLDVNVDEFHDAPILYISGKDSLQFTKEQEAKLKEFVEGGGM